MYAFNDLAEVEETLRGLTEKQNGPFGYEAPHAARQKGASLCALVFGRGPDAGY